MAFKEVTATFYVHLMPTALSNLTAAITRELGALVLTYHENLGGVVLALRHLSVPAAPTRMLFDSPYIHVHVTADVLLFAPQIGVQLSGKVNFLGSTHIGLLLQGVVNVSIMADKVPDNYVFDEDDQGEPIWFEEGKEDTPITMDSVLDFFVTKVNVRNGDISLQASLMPEDFKPETEEVDVTPHKNKKDKKEKSEKRDKRSNKRKSSDDDVEEHRHKSSKKLKKKRKSVVN